MGIVHSSPFLFWTIIIISTRFHPTLAHIYQDVVASYRGLLGKVLAEEITALESIQGIVLLCLWPLAVDKQTLDPTWNYCGLVTNAAMRMGLHKDGTNRNITRSPISKTEARIRAKTWMACMKVNSMCDLPLNDCKHQLTVPSFVWSSVPCLHLEIPNTTSILSGSPSQIETDFATKLEIGRQSIKAAVLMSRIHQQADISMTHLICRDLDDVKHMHHNTWSEEAEIELLGAQLNTYTFQLQQMSQPQYSPPSGSENTLLKSSLITLGFTAAARIIHTFSTMSTTRSTLLETQTHDSREGDNVAHIQRYLPKHYFITLLFAASFIFKAMANYKDTDSSQSEIACNCIRQTYRMLSSWSEHEMDELGRAARMIQVLSHVSNLSGLKEFKSHGSASRSILEDATQAAKEIRESMEMKAAGSLASQYGTPYSVGAGPASKFLTDDLGPGLYPDPDVVNDVGLDWDLLGGYNLVSSSCWVPGFGAEPGNITFSG